MPVIARRPLLLGLAALASRPAHALESGEWPNEGLQVGAVKRSFRLVVPADITPGRAPSLVIALHGMGKDSKDLMPRYSGFSASAHRHEFAVAYAQALSRGWGQRGADERADLEYLDALYDELKERLKFDPKRVHLIGFSSGARLALQAAAARPGRFASLVVHSTLLPAPAPTTRMPPQLWVHGERDIISPIAKAKTAVAAAVKGRQRAELIGVPELGHQWARQSDINTRIWTFMALQTLGAPQ